MSRHRGVLIAAVVILTVSAGQGVSAQAAKDQRESLPTATYTVLIGSGFLCGPGDTSMCPATVRGNAGDSYEITGAGTFDAQTKSALAAGTYAHRSVNGNILETGVWVASELVAFDSYGAALSAVSHPGSAFGTERFRSKGFMLPSGPVPTGGLAAFRIRLLPSQGPQRTALLQVNCALGDVPRERSVEGIRLTVEKSGTDFSEEVSGRVMFLSTPSEVNVSAKEL